MSTQVVASGPLSIPKRKLCELIAETQTFQTWPGIGLTYPDAAAATKLIDTVATKHIWSPCTREDIVNVRDYFPFAVVTHGGQWGMNQFAAGAANWLRPAGRLAVIFCDIDRYDNRDDEASLRYFENQVGNVLKEMAVLSGQNDRLDFHGIDEVQPAELPSCEEEATAAVRWIQSVYTIEWS